MKFGNPNWLWAILVLPVFYGWILLDEQRRQKQFAQFAERKLWPLIAPGLDWKLRSKKSGVILLVFLFTLLALARPQWGSHEEMIQASGLDMIFALDVSSSMDVEDVVPSRLLKAKHMIRSIADRLDGDRAGVVAFAYSSYLACPLTTDLEYLLQTIQILSPKTIQNQGTDIGSALETSLKALERGSEEVSPAHPNAPSSRVIILLSDGEDQEDQALSVAAKIKASGAKLYVFGIGTEAGGPIPIKEEGQAQSYKRDRSGKVILSTFSPDFLKNLAETAGGKYWTVTPGEIEAQELLKELGALDRSDYSEKRYLIHEDRFQIPLFMAIALLFIELFLPARKILVCVGMGVGFAASLTSSAFAEDLIKKPASLDTYLNNKKGIEAYQEGRLEEAQKEFGAAQARDPSRAELEFNQGVVQMQRGESDRAIEAFRNSIQGSQGAQNPDLSLTAKAWYNLGNAYAKKENLKEAIESYLGAIQTANQAKDSRLEQEARKNLQLLVSEKMKKEEKKKQEDQQQQQSKDSKPNSDSKSEPKTESKAEPKTGNDSSKNPQDRAKEGDKPESKPDGKPDEKNKDQASQDQKSNSQSDTGKDSKKEAQSNPQPSEKDSPRYQENSKYDAKRAFNSKKMDRQDAERVLSELGNRERELQEKLNNQNGRSQNNPKDW